MGVVVVEVARVLKEVSYKQQASEGEREREIQRTV